MGTEVGAIDWHGTCISIAGTVEDLLANRGLRPDR